MKNLFAMFCITLSTCGLAAQAPVIQWSKAKGGSLEDGVRSVKQTPDGGYVMSGYARSQNGEVVGNHGSMDFWVNKLASDGTAQWSKCMGGSGYDVSQSIALATDGGYLVAGYTGSNDDDIKFTNHGGKDIWVVKLSAQGAIQWKKTMGGSLDDQLGTGYGGMEWTPDNGYILEGHTLSMDGDVSANHGEQDIWVVKLNETGAIEWEKSLGGSNFEFAGPIHSTTDGGYIASGITNSTDGDVTENHGDYDIWVVKLDATGDILWQKTFGGSNEDDVYSIRQTQDGGFVVLGATNSSDGDLSVFHQYDSWLIKLDPLGNLEWQKFFVGVLYDVMQDEDGNYLMSGNKGSGQGNLFVQKLDESGNVLWQGDYGGTDSESGYTLIKSTDGGYLVAANTFSNDIDVTGNHGSVDAWIVKLSPESPLATHEAMEIGTLRISPNPAQQFITLQSDSKENLLEGNVVDPLGREVMPVHTTGQGTLDISHLPSGHYTLTLYSSSGKRYVQTFTKA